MHSPVKLPNYIVIPLIPMLSDLELSILFRNSKSMRQEFGIGKILNRQTVFLNNEANFRIPFL